MANPALRGNRLRSIEKATSGETVMSYSGVLRALGSMSIFGAIAALVGWHYTRVSVTGGVSSRASVLMLGAVLAAFVVAMVLIMRPKWAKGLGIAYSVLEGVAVGVISKIYEIGSHGIVGEALGVSLGVAVVVWFLYATKIIRVTSKVVRAIVFATMGACAFYLVSLFSVLLGGPNLDGSGGLAGVGISLILALIAASTFLTDWYQIDALIASGAEESYNWYGAFSLLLSFIWLYLEVLRLLLKLRR
jgi:uncharacterized YccA/Bax inhibitor family protein